jgi:hypothetical protein
MVALSFFQPNHTRKSMPKNVRTRGRQEPTGATDEEEGTSLSKAMRRAQGFPQAKPKQEPDERAVKKGNCLHCNKDVFGGWYGSFGEGGVCSKTCNEAQEKKPRYLPPLQKEKSVAQQSL